jgi:DNA-directed RNA polymerase subunit RPC12/RpoP
VSSEAGLRCLRCGENLIRESPITPVGASIFERQDEKPQLRCPVCGTINVVKWDSDSGFQSISTASDTPEEPTEQTGLFCLNCQSRMEFSPPPWKKPTQIVEAGKKSFAICGTCGSRNEIDTIEGKTVTVKLA